MSYKIGDVSLDPAFFDRLPVGSVIRPTGASQTDNLDRTKLASGRWSSTTYRGRDVEATNFLMDYELIRLPEVVKTEPDPVQELADELWDVRKSTVEDLGYFLGFETKTSEHNKVYRALASWVLDREDALKKPSKLTDDDGDEWTLRSNGMYSVSAQRGHSTYEDIKQDCGIRSETR